MSLKYPHQFAQFLAQLNIIILNICPLLHFHQLAKDKKLVIHKQLKSDFVEPFLLPGLVQILF